MRSTKIENVNLGVQFAFGGFDGHKADNVNAVLTRKGSSFLLTTNPATKDEMQREMRRDDRILVDYDTSTVKVKTCPRCGAVKVANPSARIYCQPCYVAYHANKKAQVAAGTWRKSDLGDADAALTKRDASRRIAEAKVDRLMAMLAATSRTVPQVYRDQDAMSA